MSVALEHEAAAKFPYKGIDHKAWAKRILYRDERGDKDLTSLQVQFAKMAMGLKEDSKP